MRKVKTLLHGDAPTSDELAQVLADPNALRTLVTQWVETEAFKTKMNDFFTVTLQQRFQVEDLQQFDRLRRSGDFSRGYTRILEESFVRTALDIIEREQWKFRFFCGWHQFDQAPVSKIGSRQRTIIRS